MRNQRRISSLIVHRMQREITMLIIVVFMCTMLMFAFFIHLTYENALADVSRGGMGGSSVEFLYAFKKHLLDWLFFTLAAGLFAIGFTLITSLHRAVGPLDRIVHTLRSLGEGEVPREVKLRERDYFTELAEGVNAVIRRSKNGKTGGKS